MNIRAKLFLLVFGMIVFFSVAVSVYFVMLDPVTRIEKERAVLDDLAAAMSIVQIEANRLDSAVFHQERPRFDTSLIRLGEAFKHLQDVKYLRKVDPQLAEAIEIIERLQNLNDENLRAVKDFYQALYQDAEAVFVFADDITFRRFYNAELIDQTRKKPLELALYNLGRIDSAITVLNDSLDTSRKVISEQGGAIAARIEAIRRRALILSVTSIALIILGTVALAVIAANSIARNVIRLASGVARLRDGDLSVEFDIKGRDEVVSLSRGMNEFIRTLDDSVLGIKDAASRNAVVGERLAEAARTTGSSIDQLREAVGGVESQARLLDDRIGQTKNSVQTIAAGVGSLDERISDQIAMVEESTASITQMLATIANMAQLAEKDRQRADSLVRVSDSGREVFQAAFEKIEIINERVGKIEEMIQIIDTIAGQTNLLAMNAAIEAAHAGEAGKGFAVVSDEIRKLAEASAEGSREIAVSVRAIVDSISGAREGSLETNKAFGEIEASIRDVSRSVVEISSSLAETDTGGQQILTAMTALRELSSSISEESSNVSESARSISASMGDLDQVSDSVRGAMGAIGGRSDEIARTTDQTSDLARELSSIGSDLKARIARFKTRCEDEGGSIAGGGACEPGEAQEGEMPAELDPA